MTNTPPPAAAAKEASTPIVDRPPQASIWEIYFPRNLRGDADAIYVASFPPVIYFWPTMLAMLFCALLQGTGVDGVFLGWATVFVFGFNILVLVRDFDQKKFIIVLLVVVALALLVWIINIKGFTFLKTFTDWFFGFQPTFSTDAYLLLGGVLLVLFGWGLTSPVFDYWRLENNEFIHFVQPMGREMSIARLGCTINREVPDVFEFLLLWGGGSLLIKREGQVLATIPHVPFLNRRMKAIENMLSETRVTVIKEREA